MSDNFEVIRFGAEAEPLVIIDDFSSDPAALKDQACASSFAVTSPHYPGLRAQADPSYLGERMDTLKTVLTDVFDLAQGASMVECAYSLVTTPPSDLKPIQRLPHFDTTDPKRLALLHYLVDERDGGTAFYQHKSSGFETVTPQRLSIYSQGLEAEIAADGLPPETYFRGASARFERIGQVAAKFNRMVLYRSYRLHSGDIPETLQLSPDPAKGRLTVNTFLQGR